MNHPPTRLALLISLIGAGMAPGVQASVDPVDLLGDHAIGSMRLQAGVPCDPLGAFALDECGPAAEQVWQPVGRSLDRVAPVGVRVLYTAPGDDWAPAGSSQEAELSAVRLERRGSPSSEVLPELGSQSRELREKREKRKAGEMREASWLSEGGGLRGLHVTRDRGGVRETFRGNPLQQARGSRKPRLSALLPAIARAPLASIGQAEISIERVARLSTSPVIPTARHVEATTTPTVRLLESLAAVLHESQPAATDAKAAATMPAEVIRVPEGTRLHAAALLRVERTQLEAETQTSRVLRQLEAIVANERDEVGATRPQASGKLAMAHADKVFLMLGEISSSTQPPAEAGAERRLRKLAARAAQAEAKAATEAAATLAAEIAHGGVDLMLPLAMPATSPPLSAAQTQPAPAVIEPVAAPDRMADADGAVAGTTPATRAPRRNPFGDDRQQAVAEGALDRVRGGFSINGLNISFGLERAVYVNGALVTTTSLNVSDLGRITAGRGTGAFDAGTIGLIQSGAGNVVSPTMISAGSVGTVVQNTLDGQKIQNITVINATSNGLGVLKGLNLHSSLRGAVIDSLRR